MDHATRQESLETEDRMSIAQLKAIRTRVMPMLQLAAAEYQYRVPPGYPQVTDAAERGMIGLQLDPSYALNFISDGNNVYAEFTVRAARTDTLSSASREKFGGAPEFTRRPVSEQITDNELRNMISELMSHWNFQPGIIHITDT